MSRKRAAITDRYDQTDLIGLKVTHSESLFKEGQDVILTLKDSNVLDEQEDVLENVNLVDLEKSNRNIENRSAKTDYNPFEEPEYDNFGRFKKKSLLSKYDEEINGLKKDAFRIGLDEKKKLEQLEEIKKTIAKERGEISLAIPKYKVASEYFTEEEIVAFKKPKKSKKLSNKKSKIKNEIITAESLSQDLNFNSNDDHGNRNNGNSNIQKASFDSDHGSRRKKEDDLIDNEIIDEAFIEHQNLLQNVIKKKVIQKLSSKNSTENDLNHRSKRIKKERDIEIKNERNNFSDEELKFNDNDNEEDDFQIPDEEIFGTILEEDDLQKDLMKSLDNARKLKQKERVETIANLDKLTETIKSINDDEVKNESTKILTFENDSERIINSTSEFCRNLGDVKNLNIKNEEEDELLDFEKDLLETKKEERMELDDENSNQNEYNSKSLRNKWSEVDFKTEQPKTIDLVKSNPILEEEPDVSCGVAGALQLAMKKGYLDKDIKKANISAKSSSLQAKNYTIEEKFYDDKFNRRERYSGMLQEFREKSGYKPDVKLEYNDDNGRQLNEKEAFRVLSHKFHGKGPGKNKIDKRAKKLEQESKLKSMLSNDTPLGTTRLLHEKQKELQTPYLILSQSVNQNILSKKP